jgi:Cu-Zn family superoxide dismutase
VKFTQDGDKVKVSAHIEGLTPGQKHAVHVHQFGDCSAPDGMSAGGHYNPESHEHGLPEKPMRHAGDLGNLTADNNGMAHYEITVDNISIAGVKNPIIGRAVIVHAKVDDGGQPVGNAGARIGCGVIGIANTAAK